MIHRASLHASRGLALASVVLFAACGGGGGAGSEATPASPAPTPSACDTPGTVYQRVVKTALATGLTGSAAIASCGGSIESPSWAQTSGPSVALQSARSQTMSFEPVLSGRYTFRVEFGDGSGTLRREDFSFDVLPAPPPTVAPLLTLRLSQSVRMGGNVSVRAWPTPGPLDDVASITWTQTEGPTVTLDTRDPYVALFVAPPVSRDTPIRLRATMTTRSGQTAADEVLVLVEQYAQAAASDSAAVWGGDHVSRVHAYKATSPYAGVLARCVYDARLRDDGTTSTLCPLSELPFLAQQTGGALPSIEQVLDRVVVSHDWMGRNFETFLRTFDGDGAFRRMLMSTTAVVIGAQVRPSFYYAATGAIYLDADNFWLLPEERDTVNEAPDYRSGFGTTLQYTTLWRYVRGATNIFQFFDPRQRITRFAGDLRDEAGWLMFHELGHALDFLPPAAYASLVDSRTAWGNIAPRYQAGQLTSDVVATRHPLTSTALAGLGQVRFFGATATATQEAYTPAQVAAFFSADLATDDYAYASRREDTAMALEEFLMQRHLALKRDFAVVPRPGPGATGSTLIVQWGQRGRIGEPALRPRLRAIVQQLAPWIDVAEVDQLPAPLPMRVGDSWTGNLALPGPPPPTSPRLTKEEPTLQELWLLEQAQRRRLRLQPQARPLPATAPAR